MSELRPCPFCGGRSTVRQVTLVRDSKTQIYSGYFPMCEKCLTTGNNYPTEEAAQAAWNNRTSDTKLRDELKKVMYAMSLISDGSAHSAKGILARVVHELWPREEQEAQEWQSY